MLWKYVWKFYLREYPYFLMILLGTSVGVAAIVSTDRAVSDSFRSFELHSRAFSGGQIAYLRHESELFSEEDYFDLKEAMSFMHSKPILEGELNLPDGKLKIWGEDPIANLNFAGTFFSANGDPGFRLADLISEPDSVLLFEGSALSDRVRDGKLSLEIGGESVSLNVAGFAKPKNPELAEALKNLVYADVPTAQKLLGAEGRLNKVGLDFAEAGEARLEELLEGERFGGFRLVKTENSIRLSKELSASLNLNLKTLGLLALLVGMFIIFNAMTFLGFKRKRFQGLLLCLGMRRGAVLRIGLFESFAMGILGGLLGVLLSVPVGWWIGDYVSGTFTSNQPEYEAEVFALEYAVYLKGFLLAVAATLASGLPPALESARVSPAVILRRGDESPKKRRRAWVWLPTGAIVLAGGRLLLETTDRLSLSLAFLFVSVLGLVILLPGLYDVLIGVLRRCARGLRKGWMLKYAVGALSGASGKLKVLFTALTLAVSVAVSVEIMLESFRETFREWIAVVLSEDVYLTRGEGEKPFVLPDWVDSEALLENVSRAKTLYPFKGFFQEREIELYSYRVSKGDPFAHFVFHEEPTEEGKGNYLEGNGIFVSEVFANKFGVRTGESLRISSKLSREEFRVEGIYKEFSAKARSATVGPGSFAEARNGHRARNYGLTFKSEELRERFFAERSAGVQKSGLALIDNPGIIGKTSAIMDRSLAATGILSRITLFVALIGCFSALLLMRNDQERNFAVLRRLGCRKSEIRRARFYQAAFLGTLVTFAALLPGFYFAWIEIHLLNLKAFGWTLNTHVKLGQILPPLLVCPSTLLLASLFFPDKKNETALPEE